MRKLKKVDVMKLSLNDSISIAQARLILFMHSKPSTMVDGMPDISYGVVLRSMVINQTTNDIIPVSIHMDFRGFDLWIVAYQAIKTAKNMSGILDDEIVVYSQKDSSIVTTLSVSDVVSKIEKENT